MSETRRKQIVRLTMRVENKGRDHEGRTLVWLKPYPTPRSGIAPTEVECNTADVMGIDHGDAVSVLAVSTMTRHNTEAPVVYHAQRVMRLSEELARSLDMPEYTGED